MFLPYIEIMISDFVGKLHGFYFSFFGLAFVLRLLLLLFEEEFPIVNNLRHGDTILDSDLDEIELADRDAIDCGTTLETNR